MSADTIVADGAPTILTAPPPAQSGGVSYAYVATGFAVDGNNPDLIDVAFSNGQGQAGQQVVVEGFSPLGKAWSDYMNDGLKPGGAWAAPGAWGTSNLKLVTDPGKGIGITWLVDINGSDGQPSFQAYTAGLQFGNGGFTTLANLGTDGTPSIFSKPGGYHVEWTSSSPGTVESYQQDFSGFYPTDSATSAPGGSTPAYANILIGGADFLIQDNRAQLAGKAAVTVPGEPAHAITEAQAAALADGHDAAVAWIDSGTGHVSIYDASTNSFSGNITLDWGGANDVHVVALPDGGFAVSWMKDGANYGQLFDAAGNGGVKMSLAGQFAAINSKGELYTVGLNASGQEAVQTYYINGPGGPGSGSTVSTSDANYTAPNGVSTIILTGSDQRVHANNGGDTIWSNDTGNSLFGGKGDDTFHLGTGGDYAEGGQGADTFDFAAIPSSAGSIGDFSSGDVLDLTGLMATTTDTGTDGFADGYLKLVADAPLHEAQLWARHDTSGPNDGWLLVTNLDGFIGTGGFISHGNVITLVSPSQPTHVSTSDADYTVPDGVTTVTLTGSNQTIHANNPGGVVIFSDDTKNTLIGGPGGDMFFVGRAGDTVTGGGGYNVFYYDQVPWGGSTITDFQSGDLIDLTSLMRTTHDTGTDGFADGYLKIASDSAGNAQVWANYNEAGNDNWWLVATLNGVSTANLQTSGDAIIWTGATGSGGGSTGGGSTGGSGGGSTASGVDTLTAKGGPVDLGSGNVAARGYTTVDGSDEVVVAYTFADRTDVEGFDLSGHQLFFLPEINTGMGSFLQSFSLASAGGAGFVMALTYESQMSGTSYNSNYQLINAAGQTTAQNFIHGESSLTAFSAQDGAHLEWNTVGYPPNSSDPSSYTYTAADLSSGGAMGPTTTGGIGGSPVALIPYANTQVGLAGDLVITDNSARLGSRTAVTLPSEPAHALSQVAAAGLASGTTAAVAWVDSGAEHLSIYDASGNSFGANLTLDWGGASDTHVVALRDGGFVVSWMKGGAYYGEVFDAAGDGGGKISLAGDVAGVDSAGDLYTVGLVSSANNQHYQVQVYAISGAGGPAPSTVYTSDSNYTAPNGVSTIYLTGSNQTVHANNGGDTIWSDNTHNVLYGGAGNDTFHVGRAGDTVTGGGGNDTFAYAEVPWGGSTITDFQTGDTIDLRGAVATLHASPDPFTYGYLKYATDSSGNAQVWANFNAAGNDGWWLVTTLDGVSTSSLHYANGLIT